MNTTIEMHSVDGWVPRYVTAKDACEFFTEEMHSLYLLSYLLIPDRTQAEQCLIAVLGDSVEGFRDFLDWASVSLAVIAIQAAGKSGRFTTFGMVYQSSATFNQCSPSNQNKPFAAITSLGCFERFVFVMSVLEGRTDDECATLLGCCLREVVMGRQLAQRVLATTDFEFRHPEETQYPLVAN